MRSTVRSYQAAVVLLTAALVATLTVAVTGGDRADAVDGPVDVVYVATGRNFPDALAGATLATSNNAPLLTVNSTLPIPPDTVAALEALDPDRLIIFGGAAAVSDEIAGALAAYARSGQVTRIEGDDRHGTAAAIASALPDKVADADLLDGHDATDFVFKGEFITTAGVAVTPPIGLSEVVGHTQFVADQEAGVRYGAWWVELTEPGAVFLRAQVDLPEQATITGLVLHATDDNPDVDLIATLNRRPADDTVPTAIVSAQTAGFFTDMQSVAVTDIAEGAETILGAHTYDLTITTNAETGWPPDSSLQLRSVEVLYEITRLGFGGG